MTFALLLVVVGIPGYPLVLASTDLVHLARQRALVEKNLDIAFTAADNAVGQT